jgi:hypothetical protein
MGTAKTIAAPEWYHGINYLFAEISARFLFSLILRGDQSAQLFYFSFPFIRIEKLFSPTALNEMHTRLSHQIIVGGMSGAENQPAAALFLLPSSMLITFSFIFLLLCALNHQLLPFL